MIQCLVQVLTFSRFPLEQDLKQGRKTIPPNGKYYKWDGGGK